MQHVSRRQWMHALGATISVITLAACASPRAAPVVLSKATATPHPAAASPKATVRQPVPVTGSVRFMTWGSPQAIADRKQFCVDFERAHPGASCTFILATGNYTEKLLTMIAGNNAPDVFFVNATDIPIMVTKQVLRALDEYVQRSHYDLRDFIPAALAEYQRSGKTYGLPRAFGMEAILYNVDLFQKAGVPPVPTDWKNTNWDFSALATSELAGDQHGAAEGAIVPLEGRA